MRGLQKQREEAIARRNEATDAELAASEKRADALERAFETEKAARLAAETAAEEVKAGGLRRG